MGWAWNSVVNVPSLFSNVREFRVRMSGRSVPSRSGAATSVGSRVGIHSAAGHERHRCLGNVGQIDRHERRDLAFARPVGTQEAGHRQRHAVQRVDRHAEGINERADHAAVAQVDADVRAVVVDDEVAALCLALVARHQPAAGEPAQVAGGTQPRAADPIGEPDVAERAEDETGAVEQRRTLAADAIRDAQVLLGRRDDVLGRAAAPASGPFRARRVCPA